MERTSSVFFAGVAVKYGFQHIGMESVNEKSKAFAEKLEFWLIDDGSYVVEVERLIPYFQRNKLIQESDIRHFIIIVFEPLLPYTITVHIV